MLFPNLEDHFQSALDSFFADSDEETDNVWGWWVKSWLDLWFSGGVNIILSVRLFAKVILWVTC
jgi:hypothetical protein